MPSSHTPVHILGGGLAGSEAAWQLAERGLPVTLVEMRPVTPSPAHSTGLLGELVCSNSLKSEDPDTAAGALKHELHAMGSLVLRVARQTRVDAGGALAVDRTRFAETLTRTLASHPLIEIERAEAVGLPEGQTIVATGPLTSAALEPAITRLVGETRLSFFDAAAPVVEADSLDHAVVFKASRYDKGGAHYLNAPLDRTAYERLVTELVSGRRVIDKTFDRRELFAACQPVEEVARTGTDALRYGALKPVGLIDPRTGTRPWAVVQLRAENADATAYNLVGFQTNLTWPEQRRIFSMIPGLEHAEFVRLGVMHRNTFIDAPRTLDPTLACRTERRVRFAGQLTGTEGYLEAAGTGLLAALNTFADLRGVPPVVLPRNTALGSLIAYATDPCTVAYQPMHVNWGIVERLEPPVRRKRERYRAYGRRAAALIDHMVSERRDIFCGATL